MKKAHHKSCTLTWQIGIVSQIKKKKQVAVLILPLKKIIKKTPTLAYTLGNFEFYSLNLLCDFKVIN
jgi:hypothetical protein